MSSGTYYTSASMLEMIGSRIKSYRIHLDMKQTDLAERSGVSLKCVQRIESGHDIQVSNLFKVLSALGLSDNIEVLIPDAARRPSDYLNDEHVRKRVRRSSSGSSTISDTTPFRWGEDR